MEKTKVYITRDEGDSWIWVWKKPKIGNWSPQQLSDCSIVNWQREDIEEADCYLSSDFKKKFSMTIRPKTKKCVHLSTKLLNNEDYKLLSNDAKRKK
jgi:hypothetical protein